METLEYSFFENLYMTKCLWDEGFSDEFLDQCGSMPVDTDEYFELFYSGIASVFGEIRSYYNDEREIEILVFFDPLIDEYFKLCALYEAKAGVSPENNSFRRPMQRTVHDSFGFVDYSADWWLYDETHGRARLVVLMSMEFASHYALPSGLAYAKNEIACQLESLKLAMARLNGKPVVSFPIAAGSKEAA